MLAALLKVTHKKLEGWQLASPSGEDGSKVLTLLFVDRKKRRIELIVKVGDRDGKPVLVIESKDLE